MNLIKFIVLKQIQFNNARIQQRVRKIVGDKYYDFSYSEIIKDLKEDHYIAEICEGLGTLGVEKTNGIFYFIMSVEGELIEYSTFLHAFKIAHEEKERLRKKHKRE